jgi:hypothetical protein
MTTEIEQQLRTEIMAQLKRVTSQNAPNVWKLIQTESGYRDMENSIVRMVAVEGLTPSACIPQIENELVL